MTIANIFRVGYMQLKYLKHNKKHTFIATGYKKLEEKP